MKYIVKRPEPASFAAWKVAKRHQPDLNYNHLVGALKQDVKEALMDEQGYICCYCERRIQNNNAHIEHFRPQSDPETDSLDYSNMLCSCQRTLKKGAPRHCGNLKSYWYDEELLVSPLDPDCEERFLYHADGRIKAADRHDASAWETIEHLGLGISKLNDLRAKAIEPFLDEDLSPEELDTFVTAYLKPNRAGKYGEFWTTIRYLFGDPEKSYEP